MDNRAILERINEVIRTDAVTTDTVDFLSVHIPFKGIKYGPTGNEENLSQVLGEDEIYKRFLLDDKEEHKFIIVRGDNGTGKSHLIRFLHEKYKQDVDKDKEEIIFISKYQSTLRDAIEQLINSSVIRNTSKYDEIKVLIEANEHLDDDKLKDNIVHQFAIEIEHSDDIKDRRIKRGLRSLILNQDFKEYLMRDEGPIDRIYSKLVVKDDDSIKDDVDPIFYDDDFVLDRGLVAKMRDTGERDAVRLAERLIRKDALELSTDIAKILNSFLDVVIQTCTNLRSTDLKKLFFNIRKELKKQGKSLTLFIEDITSFTGVDKAIVDVLVTEHKGIEQNKEFCRLCSIVGITTEYYKHKFPSHLKDRVTDQLFIEREVFGDIESLKELAGRYINAIYKPKEEFKIWVENGGLEEDYPAYENEKFENWDYVELPNGKSLTLYPFTEYAIKNLYANLEHKSPRAFLKEVLRKYLESYFRSKDTFLSHVSESLPAWSQLSHATILSNQVAEKELNRLSNIFRLWGDGTIYKRKHENYTSIGGINTKFFYDINCSLIEGVVDDLEDPTPIPVPSPDQGPREDSEPQEDSRPEINKEFQEIQMEIENWAAGEPLKNFRKLRDDLHNFLVTSINWQQQGVSSYLVFKMLNTKGLIGIEGQTQGLKSVKIFLDRSIVGRMVLLALAAWRHLGKETWNFDNAAEYQLYLTNWMLSVKDDLIQLLKAPFETGGISEDLFIKTSLIIDYYRLAIAGKLTGDEEAEDIYRKLMRKEIEFKNLDAHTDRWKKTAEVLNNKDYKENHTLIYRYYGYVLGDASRTPNLNKNFIDSQLMLEKIKENHNNNWDIPDLIEQFHGDESNIHSQTFNLIKRQYKLLKETCKEEEKKSREIVSVLDRLVGQINVDSIIRTLNKIQGYLSNLLDKYQEPFEGELLDICTSLMANSKKIYDNYLKLQEILDQKTVMARKMALLSSNPYEYIEDFTFLLIRMANLVETHIKKYSKKLELQKEQLGKNRVSNEMIEDKLCNIHDKYNDLKGVLDSVNR